MRRTTQPSTRQSPKFRCPVRCSRCRPGTCVGAFGVFYKEDKYEYTASPVASVFLAATARPDIQGFSASEDINGDDHNLDLYMRAARAAAPRRTRVSQSLETVLGYRLSDYASAGSFDSWKAELLYQPIESHAPARLLPARGARGERVRALPAAAAAIFDFFFFEDGPEPCDVDSAGADGPDAARVEALCLAQGVPAALLPTFGTRTNVQRGRRRQPGPRAGRGIDDDARAWSGPLALASPASRTCRCRSTGTGSRSTDKIWSLSLRGFRAVLLRRPLQPGLLASRTSGARFSAATPSTGEIDDCTDVNAQCR